MRYLAALDHDHLDNGVFLTSVARSLAEHQQNKQIRSVIVHADSAYTERIMQTGVMREEAVIRSQKDLSKRLVALFADQGVSTIGINPYQKNFITLRDDKLHFDRQFFDDLPKRPVLLLSSLVQNEDRQSPVPVELPAMMRFLKEKLQPDECFLFTKADKAEIFTSADHPQTVTWQSMPASFREQQIPDEFNDFSSPVRLTTGRDFSRLPDLDRAILIK